MTTDLISQYLSSLMPSEKAYLARVQSRKARWIPRSKPQWLAFLTRADELFYGGAGGGGKSDLVIGLATECHQHSVIFRRVYPNLKAIILRSREVIGTSAKENKAEKIWNYSDGRTLEFGAVQFEGNKTDWQGRPHDLKAFDELPEFAESQYEFICGWNRSTDPGQRVRIVATGNPPIDESGGWIIRRWAAWLDKKHPHPAAPGELRYYATLDGKEHECEGGAPFDHKGEIIYPRSRTFIPARLDDNPFYAHDNHYRSILQSLPEPLRSKILYGDFDASQAPDPWQVIPTDWVRLAQKRWREREKPNISRPTGVGLDPSRGGMDKTALAKRYDNWFDEVKRWPGVVATDGPTVAGLVQQVLNPEQPGYLNIDIGGIGSAVYDSLKIMYKRVIPVNFASGSIYRDRSKTLKMRNLRAELYWRMRDALDPVYGDEVALPPDTELLADLCSARYTVTSAGVQIEEKDEIKKRIGRSPDVGEAAILALYPGSAKVSGTWGAGVIR